MPVVDRATYEERLEQLAALAGRSRHVEELSGGLTNLNLKVTTPDGVFVARCGRSDTELLGIDRDAEHHNSVAAASVGVGAPVVEYRPDLQIMLIGWLEGTTCTDADLRRPGVLPRVADAVRRLHEGPRFVNEFHMPDRQARFRRIVDEREFAFPSRYDDHADAFARAVAALASDPVPTKPCNNDLLADNLVDDGTRVHLIDYEYAGNNDPFFELGNTCTETGLPDDACEELVTCYLGRPDARMLARTRLQAVVSQYGWALWGYIQAASSPLDFDFTGWGDERLDGAAAAFTGDRYSLLLDEVARA
ncbi:MAG: choline/ethanolamine kinase family protein [Nocardioidaceae bacterium]|nr:choline/ethanolamine kinase family protein [Nocardioidaceae bacterium]